MNCRFGHKLKHAAVIDNLNPPLIIRIQPLQIFQNQLRFTLADIQHRRTLRQGQSLIADNKQQSLNDCQRLIFHR